MGKISKKTTVLCIQPHSDDILFSASHVLFSGEYNPIVFCVEYDPKRAEEDKRLYEFLGISYYNLGIEFKDNSYYEFFKRFGYCTAANVRMYLEEYFGNELLNKISKSFAAWVKSFMDENSNAVILAPLGVGHPFHFFVHELVCSLPYDCLFYREFPHSYKRRNKTHMSEIQSSMRMVRSVPIDDWADVKWKLASKFYRTQSGLMFYEQGYIKKNLPEEVYAEV